MTKTEALYKFFSSFGITAYPSNAVPEEAKFPWLTYEPTIGDMFEQTNIAVNLYYHSTSESPANQKADEISKAIGTGGVILPCDDGVIWIKKGSPFIQSIADDRDITIKRRYINLFVEYMAN